MLESEDPALSGEPAQEGEFDSFLKQMESRQRESLNLSDHLSRTIPPEQAADALRTSIGSGLPLDSVFRNLKSEKERQAQLTPFQVEDLRKQAPATAAWATDPYRLAAGREDLDRLMEIEKSLNALAKPVYRPSTDEELGKLVEFEAMTRAKADFPKQPKMPALYGDLGDAQELYATEAEMAKAYKAQMVERLRKREAFQAGDTSRTSFADRAVMATEKGFDLGLKTNEAGRLGFAAMGGDDSPELKAQIDAVEKGLADTPGGDDFATNWILPGAKVLGQMWDSTLRAGERGVQGSAVGGMLGAAGGPGSVLTVPAGFVGGASVGMKTGMFEQAFITEAGNAYLDLMKVRGKNGETLDPRAMYAAAAATGTLNATLEMVGLHFLAKPFAAAGKKFFSEGIKDAVVAPTVKRAILNFGKDYALGVGSEVATEVMQEGTNILTEELAKMATNGEFETLANSPAERDAAIVRLLGIASETFRGMVTVGLPGAALNLHQDVRHARHVQETLKTIDKIVEQVKLAQTNPEEVESLAKIAAEKAGIPTMTVSADAVFQYYQQQGIDPIQRVAELTGNGETFAQAAKDKGDFEIPTEKFVTMPKEEKAFFQTVMRKDALDMSAADTEAIVQREQAKVQEANQVEAARAEAAARDVEMQARVQQTQESVRKVGESIKNALEAAGFKKEAATVSKAVAAVFKTLGERESVDPYALFSERPLTITREGALPVDETGQVFAKRGEEGQPDRGNIYIGDSKISIDLLKDADKSTFLHETGHLYLDMLGRLAARAEASGQIKADHATVLEWLGAKPGEKLTKAQHEKWAESFEAYLKEGKAPSVALRGAFYRFKQWLTEVYQGMKDTIGADLNDDIRKVMDRLLATDEEIAQAQQEQAQAPLFEDAKAAGATDAQAERYAKLIVKAQQAAEEKLLTKAMEQARRESQEWWQSEREKMRSQVEGEVNAEPVYRAISVLQTGKLPDGTEMPPQAFSPGIKNLKIDRKSIGPLFGEQYGDIDPKSLPRGITAQQGGLHADIVAGMFGFESGREFIKALQQAEAKDVKIDRITDERMTEQFGGEPTEAEIKEAALASIHSDARAEQLQLEMEILAKGDRAMLKLVGGQIPRLDVLRKEAERAVGRQKVGSINPRLYLSAERRAGNKALEAYGKGDIKTAIEARREELVNHENFRAADEAKVDVKESVSDWKALIRKSDEKLAKTRDMDFFNAARAILAAVNIGAWDKSVSSYLDPIRQYDPELYADMKALVDGAVPDANRAYTDLSYDEFKALKQAVNALLEKSTKAHQIEIDGKRLHLQEVIDPLVGVMDKVEPAKESKATKTVMEKAIGMLLGVRAAFTRVEHWASALGKEFMQAFPDKIHDATNAYRESLDDWLGRYKKILEELPKLREGEIHSDELDFTFKGGKRELLGALMHTGNSEDGSSNLHKLLLGRKWATLDEHTGVLDTSRWDRFISRMQREGVLTRADYDYVQKVWDLFEEIKPLLQKAHKQMNGYHFSEVTATPFQALGREYRGGYFPALADPSEVAAAAIRGEKADAEIGNSFSFPTAGAGATKHRSSAYWKPLRMDLDSVPQHIKWAARYINIEPHVQELRRLLWNKEFRERLDQFNPDAAATMLIPWLQRTATQTVEAPIGGGRAGKALAAGARWFKSVAGARQLGLSIKNAAQNIEGIMVASTKVSGGELLGSMKQYFTSPFQTHEAIANLSTYMKHRTQEVVGSLQETANEILKDPTIFQNVRRFTMKHVFFLSKLTQGIVDDVVWNAAFNDFMRENPHASDEAAVKHADHIVRTTQGSAAPEDISTFEAGNAFNRLLTMYTSWFNMRANLLGSEGVKIMRTEAGIPARSAKLSILGLTGFTIPALVAGAVGYALSGKKLDPDDDGYLDDVLAFFFGSQYQEAKAMAPGVGPLVDVMVNRFDKNPNNDEVNVSPALSTLEAGLSAPADLYKSVAEGKGHGKTAEDVLTAFTLITGIPTAAIGKNVHYAVDVAEGKKEASGPFDFLRGVLTGTGPGKKR